MSTLAIGDRPAPGRALRQSRSRPAPSITTGHHTPSLERVPAGPASRSRTGDVAAGGRPVRVSAFAFAIESTRDGGGVDRRFLAEECDIVLLEKEREVRSDLYAAYRSSVRDNGDALVSRERFATAVLARGVTPDPDCARSIDSMRRCRTRPIPARNPIHGQQ